MKQLLPELLAPAGSTESLRAALAAGADAVYFGSTSFSNRMRAKNFSDDALSDAIRLCHDAGARAHITVNTRVRDRETDDVLALCERILGHPDPSARADAVICADFGVAREIKKRFPNAALHASTQTSLASPADCLELRKLGFSRLVVPRELSEAEIAALCREGQRIGFEIEMFLHGAHCVSLSGQCLMSFVMGGRSGNRGECAQPCRLPFTVLDEAGENPKTRTDTPLSLADLCLAGRIPEVLASGVASLKLEGRLKPPEYVYGVTSIYRRLLDERRNASRSEVRALEELFTRGFTDGYFTARYASLGASTLPKRQSPDASGEISRKLRERLSERAAQAESEREAARQAVSAVFSLKAGEPMQLTLSCGSISVTAEGELPAPAAGGCTNAEAAARSLTKLGGTPFRLEANDLRCKIEEGLWVPVSALNALRREAAERLQAALSANDPDTDHHDHNTDNHNIDKEEILPAPSIRREKRAEAPEAIHTAEFAGAAEWFALCESLPPAGLTEFFSFFRRLYVPEEGLSSAAEAMAAVPGDSGALGGVLPPLTPNDDTVRRTLERMKADGAARVLCHTPGQLRLAQEAGLAGDLSFRANLTNAAALSVWRDAGLCASIALSPELPEGALRALAESDGEVGAVVYGKFPLMTLSRCILCGGKCTRGNRGGRREDALPHECRGTLTDRRGERFPVFSLPDCENLIVNSVPVWMGDRLNGLGSLSFLHFFFTDEKPDAVLRVLRAYRDGLPGGGRRL